MDAEERLELIAMLAKDEAWGAVVLIGQALLDEYYPEGVFTGESGDLGPRYVADLRALLKGLREAREHRT